MEGMKKMTFYDCIFFQLDSKTEGSAIEFETKSMTSLRITPE
jgi:hypothetical protein